MVLGLARRKRGVTYQGSSLAVMALDIYALVSAGSLAHSLFGTCHLGHAPVDYLHTAA